MSFARTAVFGASVRCGALRRSRSLERLTAVRRPSFSLFLPLCYHEGDSPMALFRRFVEALLVMGMVFGGGFVGAANAYANDCQCGCTFSGGVGGVGGTGPTCTEDRQCTQAACSDYCAARGMLPGVLTGARVYRCVDFSGPSVPPAPAPARDPDPAPAAPSGGGGAAPAGQPTTGPAAGGTQTAGGGAAAPAASGATFRFELPSCTENGQCTLTDIINTGVRFANFLLAISGVVFLGTFLYAGAKLLLFAYEAKQVAEAQKMVTGAFVGIVIIMVAGVAVRFVSTGLGVSSSYTRLPGRSVPSATTPAAPGGTTR